MEVPEYFISPEYVSLISDESFSEYDFLQMAFPALSSVKLNDHLETFFPMERPSEVRLLPNVEQ